MIHWNADPEIVALGPVHLRWYGLFFAIAFFVGYRIVHGIFVREKKPVSQLESLFTYVFLGIVLGARLGHVLFYDPGYYFSDPIRILKVWEGGLASHGGVLGVLISIYLYVRKHGKAAKVTYLWVLDRLTLPVLFGAGLVRLGNLMNSEIIGKPTDLPWSFVFERVDTVARHPAQLYEAISYLIFFGIARAIYARENLRNRTGFLFGFFLVSVFTARFLIEFVKEVQVASESGLLLDYGQLLSIPMVAVGIWIIVRSRMQKA